MQVLLPPELWCCILSSSLVAAHRARVLSKDFKELVEEYVLLGAVVTFPSPNCNQAALCQTLALAPAEAQTLPFKQVRLGRYAVEHRFNLLQAYTLLVQREGLKHLGARIQARLARKRKREEGEETLYERREAAAATRLASLDKQVKNQGLGESLREWAEGVEQREGSEFKSTFMDPIHCPRYIGDGHPRQLGEIVSYLSSRTLKPTVTLAVAVGAIKALDEHFSVANISLRAALRQERVDKLVEERRREAERKRLRKLVNADRRCTTPGCHNLHRAINPVVHASGPVCGACEKKEMF